MRCIDVGAWFKSKGSTTQPHLAPLVNVLKQVPEYALGAAPAQYFDSAEAKRNSQKLNVSNIAPIRVIPQPALAYSPYDFAVLDKNDFRGVLWQETPSEAEPEVPCAMVAVDDPVGITAELAALMEDRSEAFMTEPDRVRPTAASAAIMQLTDSVGHQAVLKAIEERADNINYYPAVQAKVGGALKSPIELTPAELISIRENAWDSEGYLKKYNEAQRAAWQKNCDEELKALQDAVITPLAAAYVQLLESTQLRAQFECNYNTADEQSGAAYLATFLPCIANTQIKAPQAQLYDKWLQCSPLDKSNLLLRAYALNQDRLANEMAKAAESAGKIKWGELPWEKLFDLYSQAESTVGDKVLDNLIAALMSETTGPVAKVLSQAVDGPVQLYALVAWAAAGNLPLAKVSFAGKTSGQLVREVMRAMELVSGQRPRYQAVHAELKRLQIFGVNTAERRMDVGFIGVREDGALVSGAQYQAERNNFITRRLVNWREVMDTKLRTGVAASVLSAVALVSVYEKATKSMKHERGESWLRFALAGAGLLGGVSELAGKQMTRLGSANPRYARFLRWGGAIELAGKGISAAAGFVMATVDFYRFVKELIRGNYKMAGLYFASSAAGAGLAYALLGTSLFLIGVFFALAVMVMIAIMVLGRQCVACLAGALCMGKIRG